MNSSSRKTAKRDDEEKKVTSQRSRLKTRPLTAMTTSSPVTSRRNDTKRELASFGRGNKTVGPLPSRHGKPPVVTPPPRKQEPCKRKTITSKPLCQRSQQRHDAFRAAFDKMSITDGQSEKKKAQTKKPIRSRAGSVAGGSVPPRLPSVRTSQTPSATPRPPRRRWFPDSTPEPQFHSRAVREQALQQKFRDQIGASSLRLSPSVQTPPSTLYSSSFSPENYRGSLNDKKSRMDNRKARTKNVALHGQTPPPADADADSAHVELERDGWGVHRRYARHSHLHRDMDKQKFMLKSQELQYQRIRQYDSMSAIFSSESLISLPSAVVEHYEVDSPMAIYERIDDEDLDLA